MNDYIAELTLDLNGKRNCNKYCETIYLTRFDHGKRIRLHVTDNGNPYPLTACTVVMTGAYPDGTLFAVECDINNDGTADMLTDELTFSVNGIITARFMISDAMRTYNTQHFLIHVAETFTPDITSDVKYPILEHMIRDIELMDEHGGILVDSALSTSSTHPVQNRIVTQALNGKMNANDATVYHVDTNTNEPVMDAANDSQKKTIFVNANVNGERGVIIPIANNSVHLFIGQNGALKTKLYRGSSSASTIWEDLPISQATADYIAQALSAFEGRMTQLISVKESLSNKLDEYDTTAPDNENLYPTALAVWNLLASVENNLFNEIIGIHSSVTAVNNTVSDVKAYIGYTDDDILGLCADFENKRFTRLAGAAGLSAGSDFDGFSMFGGRRRCNVADDGTINAFYGDAGYTEDGSNGQVMVYQPKFYYKVVPLKLEKQSSGLGYHIRKANYYVTAMPYAGFKLHPLFYDANGNEVEYVLLSAYEGSLYDVSAGVYINDNAPGDYVYAQGDLLCSVAGKKPISGKLAGIGTKANFEAMAQAHSSGWHLDTIKSVSANQLLMAIEFAHFNTQNAIGKGVVTCPSSGTNNCSSLTGSTAALGNATGMADATVYENGTETVSNTANDKVSVSYRGVENFWGNIWKHTNGINIWGDGNMGGGQVYIADDFDFNETRTSGNYKPVGFTVSNVTGGWISAFGYGGEGYDWLFLTSEVNNNQAGDSLPVGDGWMCTPNLARNKCALLGGSWPNSGSAGAYYWRCSNNSDDNSYVIGGRLLYVPSAAV